MTEGGQLGAADSWAYLSLAQSLVHGEGCLLDGRYFAVFPCGYAIAIAVFPVSDALPALLAVSKFSNFVLAALSFFLICRVRNEVLLASFLILNPLTLHLYQYTLSENLFLLAVAGTIFATDRIHAGRNIPAYQLLLAAFLLAGCSARYFFGPYLSVLFVATPLAYGRRTALAAAPSYVVAAIAFTAYLVFNMSMLGFATGELRRPAPETLGFLASAFLEVSAFCAAVMAVWLALFLAAGRLLGRKADEGLALSDKLHLLYVAAIGAGYLALAFFLRTRALYDLYSSRTVGFGWVLLMSAGACLLLRGRRFDPQPVAAAILLGAFSVAAGWTPQLKGWLFAHIPIL